MEVNTDLSCENSQSEMWHDRLGLTDIPTQLNLREKKTLEGKDDNDAVTYAALKLQQGRRFLAH
jgi:hypothetical protein